MHWKCGFEALDSSLAAGGIKYSPEIIFFVSSWLVPPEGCPSFFKKMLILCANIVVQDLKGRFCSEKISLICPFFWSTVNVPRVKYSAGWMEICTWNRADFTASIWPCKCQSVFRFNEQPRQTDDPDSRASPPFRGNDMQSDISEWKGHYVAWLSRRGFGRSVHLSVLRDEAQGRWSVASFASGCVWFGQIVRCWRNTFICLLLMDPPAFFILLHLTPSHPPTGMQLRQAGKD